jgi:hypothetical protein
LACSLLARHWFVGGYGSLLFSIAKELLPVLHHRGCAGSVPLLWTHFVTTVIFMLTSVFFLTVHFAVYFLVSWLH